ncbi:MAG: hypothetical protein PHX93_04935 [Candidatus Peribacteraceae bacterium]|nr:hypothetical protein [Candidatus Peribacteraceae bacterium]
MRYVLPVLIALQIAFSPVCMTQMTEAASPTHMNVPMAQMDHTEHAHHMADSAQSSPPDSFPCGHGHCFSASALESALAPNMEMPATVAAVLPSLCTIQDFTFVSAPLFTPEEPPPIVSSVETVVLLQ